MAKEPAAPDPAESTALPPYLQALIRQHRERGLATADWEARIRQRLTALEAVLFDGNR